MLGIMHTWAWAWLRGSAFWFVGSDLGGGRGGCGMVAELGWMDGRFG